MGSQYCSAGLVVQGCTADIRGNTISGFLNANGVSSGGRTGYGIYLDCNNTVVAANMLTGCKHQLTCASRSYVMQGLTVDSNTVSSAGTPTSEATLDLHANVVGAPIFSRNSIYAVRAAFGIRNGGARILDNDIVCQRPRTLPRHSSGWMSIRTCTALRYQATAWIAAVTCACSA